jgi:uncharacterized pyridoxamine 5'-phosphate oxidase family protein
MLGHFQPQGGSTILITTTDEGGEPHQRVVSQLTSDGSIYVAANHWPRAWYHQALANPIVVVTTNGEARQYVAVPVTGAEHDRVNDENRRSIGFLFLTGFPPRYFLRLDPQTPEPEGAIE